MGEVFHFKDLGFKCKHLEMTLQKSWSIFKIEAIFLTAWPNGKTLHDKHSSGKSPMLKCFVQYFKISARFPLQSIPIGTFSIF